MLAQISRIGGLTDLVYADGLPLSETTRAMLGQQSERVMQMLEGVPGFKRVEVTVRDYDLSGLCDACQKVAPLTLDNLCQQCAEGGVASSAGDD